MEITIVGSGNVAEALAGAVAACDGLHLQQVRARNSRRGRTLAERYGADYTEHPQEAAPADLYLIAVSDSAVEEVSALLHPPFGATVAHTSGGLGIDALRCDTPHRAVCYPLQTFSRGRSLDLSTVPLFIEYATERAETTVRTFAETLSCRVYEADSARRNRLHAAAVFACNFSNHLYALAGRLLEKEGLDFGILGPLVLETAAKAVTTGTPAAVQTGPAVRGDAVTMRRHEAVLAGENDERYNEIYKLLSQSIWETSKRT